MGHHPVGQIYCWVCQRYLGKKHFTHKLATGMRLQGFNAVCDACRVKVERGKLIAKLMDGKE